MQLLGLKRWMVARTWVETLDPSSAPETGRRLEVVDTAAAGIPMTGRKKKDLNLDFF